MENKIDGKEAISLRDLKDVFEVVWNEYETSLHAIDKEKTVEELEGYFGRYNWAHLKGKTTGIYMYTTKIISGFPSFKSEEYDDNYVVKIF